MKTRLIILVGILIMVSAVMIGPVTADTSGTTAVTGNPEAAVSITLNQSSIKLPLDPSASPATNATLGITVSTNTPFTITVRDNSGRVLGDQGYMGNHTGAAYDPINTKLAAALGLSGTTNGNTAAVSITPPITSGSTLYSGSAAVNNQLLTPNTFSQVVAYTDPRLPTGSLYRIDLEFAITAVA